VSRHVCKYWKPSAAGHRGFRRCDFCGRRQTKHGGDWADVMTIAQFAHKWLPAISGTRPDKLMQVDVAFPFEWNCYESWNHVYRVTFDFGDVVGRAKSGLGTRVDIMNGWTSEWRETFNAIHKDACSYYEEQTGAALQIGDNTYEEMRRFIQA
jgi:hypothetical protein